MGRKIPSPAELLQRCFSHSEWEFLKHHPDFQNAWQGRCETVDDFERLSQLGTELLADQDFPKPPTAEPGRPSSRRRKSL